jgi:predicted phosphodiesterase
MCPSKYDFVLLGHTHHSFYFQNNNTTVINPGSVGQPRDIGNLASYAIINTQNKTSQIRKVYFEIKEIVDECKRRDPEINYLQDVLKRKKYV